MTDLERRALASLPLPRETVEAFFDGSRAGTAAQGLRALCVSHERLRVQLEGVESILGEPEPETLRLRARLAAALALTDTGSPEFREAFPPGSAGAALAPREHVPGWRVVDAIRSALLGS